MSSTKSRYSGIREKSATREANYQQPGLYLVQILSCEEGVTRNRRPFNVFHLLTLADLGGPETLSAAGRPLHRHRAGEEVSWMLMVENDAFLPNLKQAIGVASGGNPNDVNEEDAEIAFGPEQPLAGVVVELSATHVLKKDAREKPVEKLTDDDYYTKVIFRRRVSVEEVRQIVPADVLTRFASGLLPK